MGRWNFQKIALNHCGFGGERFWGCPQATLALQSKMRLDALAERTKIIAKGLLN
jgi:hypothetical protein